MGGVGNWRDTILSLYCATIFQEKTMKKKTSKKRKPLAKKKKQTTKKRSAVHSKSKSTVKKNKKAAKKTVKKKKHTKPVEILEDLIDAAQQEKNTIQFNSKQIQEKRLKNMVTTCKDQRVCYFGRGVRIHRTGRMRQHR